MVVGREGEKAGEESRDLEEENGGNKVLRIRPIQVDGFWKSSLFAFFGPRWQWQWQWMS
jgi:hypothetical protein